LLLRMEIGFEMLELMRVPDALTLAERAVAEKHERIRKAVNAARARELTSAPVDRARGTKRGMQLRVVEITLYEMRVDAARKALVQAMLTPELARLFGDSPMTASEARRLRSLVEPAVREARRLYEAARASPEPSDAETEAVLRKEWEAIEFDLVQAEKAIALAWEPKR
jgi:hypothetical protein